ncbi:MAG: glycosyltransferase family 1 protein [Arenicellales bacterium]
MTRVAVDLREILFQGRGWHRYGINLLRCLVQHPGLEFLFVVEDKTEAARHFPFLETATSDFLVLPLDRRLDSPRTRHPDVDDCDIYHSPTEFPEFITRHAKTVVTIHDTSFRVCPSHMDPGFVAAASGALDRAVAEADAIAATTNWVARNIAEHAKEQNTDIRGRLHELGFGLDHLPACAQGRHTPAGIGRDYLLYVGGIERDKNVDQVLDALVAHAGAARETTFIVASRDALQLGTRLDARLRDRVILLPDVDDDALVGLYAHAAYLVAPSLDEGLGLCPLEALRLGTPSICSDIPPFREHLGRAALYFNPYSTADLRTAIERGLADKTREGLLRAADHLSLDDSTWGRCAERIATIYESVLR